VLGRSYPQCENGALADDRRYAGIGSAPIDENHIDRCYGSFDAQDLASDDVAV
jgi:hypothetical protein